MLTDLNAFTSGLQSSKGFSQQIAAATLAALQDLDNEKMNCLESYNATIAVSDWEMSDNVNFPYYCDIPVQGVTASDLSIVLVDLGNTAQDSGFHTFSETAGGTVRIKAENAPTESISATIWILKGVIR